MGNMPVQRSKTEEVTVEDEGERKQGNVERPLGLKQRQHAGRPIKDGYLGRREGCPITEPIRQTKTKTEGASEKNLLPRKTLRFFVGHTKLGGGGISAIQLGERFGKVMEQFREKE